MIYGIYKKEHQPYQDTEPNQANIFELKLCLSPKFSILLFFFKIQASYRD